METRVVDLKTFNAKQGLIDLIPADVARMYQVVPYEFDGERLGVVAADPLNYKLCEELGYMVNYEILSACCQARKR